MVGELEASKITEAIESLEQLYDGWGKPVQGTEWKQKLAELKAGTRN